jgi:hypothetical protein
MCCTSRLYPVVKPEHPAVDARFPGQGRFCRRSPHDNVTHGWRAGAGEGHGAKPGAAEALLRVARNQTGIEQALVALIRPLTDRMSPRPGPRHVTESGSVWPPPGRFHAAAQQRVVSRSHRSLSHAGNAKPQVIAVLTQVGGTVPPRRSSHLLESDRRGIRRFERGPLARRRRSARSSRGR